MRSNRPPFPGVDSEVRVEDLLVDGPEVDRVPKVAVIVQALQVRGLPIDSSGDGVADQDQRRGGAVQHLTRISDQLLLIARADAGELHPEPERIDVADFAHELAVRWQPAAETRRLELVVEAPDAGEVEADPDLTRRAIDNLLDNAFRFAPVLSTVRLAVRQEGADWVFEVSDEGPGIPVGQRERIFERFARGDSARTRSGGGAGLGLALSAAIATAQGGTLELVDRPGPGVTFRLRLRSTSTGGP